MTPRIEMIVHRKGNIYWVGEKKDAEESSVVKIYNGYSVVKDV